MRKATRMPKLQAAFIKAATWTHKRKFLSLVLITTGATIVASFLPGENPPTATMRAQWRREEQLKQEAQQKS
ncbi:hypothetical protein BsWGS_10764 [Bradybaena similaris]